MPASIATPTARRALAALLVFGGILSARAAEPPDNVQAEVAEAVQSCKDLEGTPNADAVLSLDDLNGDVGEDWIVDYAKLKCEGGINQMCGANGCTLQIFLWGRRHRLELGVRGACAQLQIRQEQGQARVAGRARLATGRAARPAISRSASTRPPSCPRPSERSEGRARFGQERQLLLRRCPAENCVAVWKATEAIDDRLMPKREIEPKRLPERGEQGH